VLAGLVEDENGMRGRAHLGGDLVEMKLHGFGVAGWQHQGGASAEFGADGAEQVGRLAALIMHGARSSAFACPAIGQLVLLADPHLVLEPDLYGRARRELLADFRHAVGEVF